MLQKKPVNTGAMTCEPGAHVAREQALRGCLAAGREKEGELVTTPRCQSAPESLLAGKGTC